MWSCTRPRRPNGLSSAMKGLSSAESSAAWSDMNDPLVCGSLVHTPATSFTTRSLTRRRAKRSHCHSIDQICSTMIPLRHHAPGIAHACVDLPRTPECSARRASSYDRAIVQVDVLIGPVVHGAPEAKLRVFGDPVDFTQAPKQ